MRILLLIDFIILSFQLILLIKLRMSLNKHKYVKIVCA